MAKKNIMPIETAKRFSVGDSVEDLDVITTTAGKVEKDGDGYLQKLGLTDKSGHIWAILKMPSNIPIIKGNNLLIKEAEIDEFIDNGGNQKKRLLISKYEVPTCTADELKQKDKFEGVIDPLVEKILEKYDIAPTDALWPMTRTDKKTGVTKTIWNIYHRYCEQIAAKAGIVFEDPEVVVNEYDEGKRTVVLLVKGRLGHVTEWSYGEASPRTTILPYIFAMAEKRAKDRVILKLAGFHGMVYSDVEMEQ